MDPVFDLAKYEKQVCLQSSISTAPPKTTIRDRVRKISLIKILGKELYTSSDPRDHPRNFIKFF